MFSCLFTLPERMCNPTEIISFDFLYLSEVTGYADVTFQLLKMINIQYIKNGSKRIRHVLIDNCMLKSLHRFPTSTSPETSGLLMEKCKL